MTWSRSHSKWIAEARFQSWTFWLHNPFSKVWIYSAFQDESSSVKTSLLNNNSMYTMINHKCLHHSYFSKMHWFFLKDNLDLHSADIKNCFILIIRKYCNSFYKWTDSYIRDTQVWTLVMLSHHFQAENDETFFFPFSCQNTL